MGEQAPVTTTIPDKGEWRGVMLNLVDHYVACYDGNEDALALRARALIARETAVKRINKYEPDPTSAGASTGQDELARRLIEEANGHYGYGARLTALLREAAAALTAKAKEHGNG